MGANHSCLEVQRLQHKVLTYDDEDLATWFGFRLAEIAVDKLLPPPSYYLRPMDVGWAVDIIRRAAEECKTREIRRSKLYETLDFLEKIIEPQWLVRRYRRELRWDRRTAREKEELREILRTTTRGIQRLCVSLLLDRLNELGIQYRENRVEIEELRRQLAIVRKTVRL